MQVVFHAVALRTFLETLNAVIHATLLLHFELKKQIM